MRRILRSAWSVAQWQRIDGVTGHSRSHKPLYCFSLLERGFRAQGADRPGLAQPSAAAGAAVAASSSSPSPSLFFLLFLAAPLPLTRPACLRF